MAKIRERGDTDFTGDDFESMPYLTGVTKVCRGRLFMLLKEGENSSNRCIGNFEDSPDHRGSDARAY